jgi:hypothetical protein
VQRNSDQGRFEFAEPIVSVRPVTGIPSPCPIDAEADLWRNGIDTRTTLE